jgi:hypothetical protein
MAGFVWGPGGEQETPTARRRLAEALMMQGTSTEPVKSWTQGIARVAQALSAGAMLREEDQREKDAGDLILKHPAFAGGSGMEAPVTASDASIAPAATSPATDGAVPRGYRNFNPLNIEDGTFARSQPGYVGTDGRFARFETMDHGAAAASNLLDVYKNKHGLDTVNGVISRWAPTSDGNNVSAYAANVSRQLGIDPNAPIPPGMRPQLVAAMAQHENGRPMPVSGGQQPYQVAGPAVAPPTGMDFSQADAERIYGGPLPPSSPVPPGVYKNEFSPTDMAAVPNLSATPQRTVGVHPALAAALTSQHATDGARIVAGNIAQVQAGNPPMPAPVAAYVKQLIANPLTRAMGVQMLDTYTKPRDHWVSQQNPDGSTSQRNLVSGETKMLVQPDKAPTSVEEYKYYKSQLPAGSQPMDYGTWSTAKARAGATNVSTNVDMGAGQTYDKLLAEGLGKSHAALSNGVEDAQTRARDLAAMQGAIDQIQRNGGTTGGLGQAEILDLKKSINAGANALGITTPFSENDISDKEFLQKFNRSMAGAQAKSAVGARVTNFEMSNYLKANPGLDLSVTGNQRLIGIQSQIEQRNIAVGNMIRSATAEAIAKGQKIDPVTVHKLIVDYDEAHHVQDPINGQDLTQSYALPEFQRGANAPMAVGHERNIGDIQIKRVK